ncbi:MAG: ABC transporter substrate-binding protein [Bacillota bacterium]
MIKARCILALLLAVMLLSGILAGCANSGSAGEGSGSGSGAAEKTAVDKGSAAAPQEEVQKVIMAFITFNKVPDDMTRINNAVSKLTREKANIEVELRPYGPADYVQRVNLALAGGEKMDLFLPGLGEFPSYVSKNQAYPLDDLIAEYGKEMTEILYRDFGNDIYKATTMNGHIYAVPVNKGMALPLSFVYNADMLKETGYTADDINTVDDLPKVFDAIKEKFPDVIPFAPINVNPSDTNLVWLLRCTGEVDQLTDPSGVGVVIGNSGKVVNLYETDLFKNGVKMMRDWYLKGYMQKDVATTPTNFLEMVSSGRAFSCLGGYSGREAGKQLSAMANKNIEMKRVTPFYFDTSAVNQVVWMISSITKVPEASMKLLNLVYSDADVLNMILWGIENEDYVKVDEHHVRYPDGKTADTVGYTAALCSGLMGSESLQYQAEGISWDDIEFKLNENKTTKRSPYFGFIFDPKDVKTELSAINSVRDRYLPVLICGAVDPDTTLPKFIQELNDAGAQTIIQKKQEQLDKWLAEQKK